MHAKYEVSISYWYKVIAIVKVDNRQTDIQANKQTERKQYTPDYSTQNIKKHEKLWVNHDCWPTYDGKLELF